MGSKTIQKISQNVTPPTNIILDVYNVRNWKLSIFNYTMYYEKMQHLNFPSWSL